MPRATWAPRTSCSTRPLSGDRRRASRSSTWAAAPEADGRLALRLQAALQPGGPPRVLGGNARPRRGGISPPFWARRDRLRGLLSRLSRVGSGAHAGRRNRGLGHESRTTGWSSGHGARVVDEEAEHPALRSRSAGRKQPSPALAPKLLADALIRPPRLPPRSRQVESDSPEPGSTGEIGDAAGGDAVTPHVAGKLHQGRKATLRKVPIPLGPERCLFVGEVQRVHDTPALPAPVAGWIRPGAGIRSVWEVAQPRFR